MLAKQVLKRRLSIASNIMKTTDQRLNNIIGQLAGVKKMLAAPQPDCFSVVVQLKAIKAALASLMEKIIAEEFEACFLEQRLKNKEKLDQIFKEIISR
jgi:DNA-binding FrmR family transcriptional regulator